MEGITSMTISSTTTIIGMSPLMKTGKQRAKTVPILHLFCALPRQLGYSRIQVQTPLCLRVEVWSLTCHLLLAPPGPRAPGVDLTHTAIMR